MNGIVGCKFPIGPPFMRAFLNAISFKLLATHDMYRREGGAKIGLFGLGRPTLARKRQKATLLFILGKPSVEASR